MPPGVSTGTSARLNVGAGLFPPALQAGTALTLVPLGDARGTEGRERRRGGAGCCCSCAPESLFPLGDTWGTEGRERRRAGAGCCCSDTAESWTSSSALSTASSLSSPRSIKSVSLSEASARPLPFLPAGDDA